jgi:hypothetical protein
MLNHLVQAGATQPKGLASFLPAIALLLAVWSYLRRKEEIGGWFFYFYYWMFLVFYFYLKDFLQHTNLFLPSSTLDEARHLALLIAVVPRLFALSATLVLMIIVANRRDWTWVQRLKLVFGVTVLIAAISVGIDAKYFPAALLVNGVRLFMLCVWFLYLCVSDRVRRVFLTRDWLDARHETAILLNQPSK